ncbi:MAG: Crp/Fnr family transcriptional regulator [Candidatus Fluviicola riflensis]|nr:MAG: Crp/Fnr family transcriptional regulator [Candidatus Fluviicola riflensis]OGS78810.1 MAG: Crp/Fnr family transcriptional regulator [Candidatus Fluviicola riflensis]OGS85832.1 MAG: Crp/Fnr family transcriptional regulator [Fluviicola sp. RIFCSPHIGHO2_12_FULL_43_24]OGS86241.1 MAG: Crp/Fnr family transcriptional regulator [Fluviicola sp. RIFCSPHIGHO2_01_FULL_43_53]
MPIKFPIDKFHFRSNSIFEGLPENELTYLEERTIETKVKKGQTVFSEGTRPNGIFYLKKGKIKKYKTNSDGKQHIIYICSSGELLGYPALLSDEPYSDSAATLEDSIIGFIPKDDFLTILEESNVLSKKLLTNLSHEFGVLVNGIAAFSYKTVRERLALSLLVMKDKYKSDVDDDKPVEINLSREDLANFVGVAVETLVRLLHDLKKEKLIETEGRKIRILDPKQLIKVANVY